MDTAATARRGLGLLLLMTALAAAEPEVYRLTEAVLVKAPPRFGVNVQPPGSAPWNPDRMTNEWNLLTACEPIDYQGAGVCDGGGADFLQHREGARLSWWGNAGPGYWDGARVQVFRLGADGLRLLRTAIVAHSLTGNDETGQKGPEKLQFTTAGPEVRAGDVYFLAMTGRMVPARPHRKGLMQSRGGYEMYDGIVDSSGGATWVLDPASPCPEGGSTASLKVTMPAKDPADRKAADPGLWHWWAVVKDRCWRFNPGKTYQGQIWLRQEGIPGAAVTVKLGTVATHTFIVDGTWKKYTFPVPVEQPAQPYQPQQGDATRLAITTIGGGTLWIDNFLIWQDDTPPFAFMPDYRQTLVDWQPSVLRLWAGLEAVTAEAALREGFGRRSSGRFARAEAPESLPIPASLRLCQEVGADPWLVLNPFWTEEDHRLLMEYLAGPADSAGGSIRTARGQARPWTEVFRRIHLECANESWNRMFQPKAWPGKPALYAAIADRQFRELRASPHFSRERFTLVLNGWDGQIGADGWTGRVAAASALGDVIDVAGYFGGWEKGTGGGGEAGGLTEFQDKLFGSELEFSRTWLRAQTGDPALGRRLAGAMRSDLALAGRLLAAAKVAGTWGDAQLPALTGGGVGQGMAALVAADSGLVDALGRMVDGLLEPIDLPATIAQRRALVRDPVQLARTCADLGIDQAAALRLGELMVQTNSLHGYASLGKERPEVAEALAAAAALELAPAVAQQVRALKEGRQPDWAVPNALLGYARKRARADLAADGGVLGQSILAQADAGLMRERAGEVQYLIDGRMRSLGERASDQILAFLRRHPEAMEALFQALAADQRLFRPQAEAVARGLASETVPLLARAPQPNPWRLRLLPLLPAEVRARLVAGLLAAADDPGLVYAKDSRHLLRACAAAVCGEAAQAGALLQDAGFIDALAVRIAANVQDALLKAAGEDASLGEGLLTALAPEPPGGKRFCVYEGGPGYALPGPGKPPAEDDENMGKSLALGTAVLDSYLMATRSGAGPACYFNFKSGAYWAHQNDPIGRIPYPTWQAMGLRNRLCSGDLMRVERVSGALRDVPDRTILRTTNDGKGQEVVVKGRKAIPLTAAYAFQDGRRVSVLLLNRDASAAHAVRLEVPGAPAAPARVLLLTADSPMANNRAELAVREVEAPPVDLGTGLVEVPAGAVAVVMFHLR